MNAVAVCTVEDVIRSFPAYQGPREDGYIIDFLGVKTRCDYTDSLPRGAHLEGYPIPMNWHATALEWAGTLRAVLEATNEIVAVELGAGWGPWLVTVARAAQLLQRGKVHLVGVEGSRKHMAFLKQHFLDNGLNPAEHRLLHGVVGVTDGFVQFPESLDTIQYGGKPLFQTRSPLRQALRPLGALARRFFRKPAGPRVVFEKVTCYSLSTLLAPYSCVDLVHIDIQGAEAEVVRGSLKILTERVKRMVIGTHSREIEAELRAVLLAQGWQLEGDEECIFREVANQPILYRDGCQVWVNPTLRATEPVF